jgi:hypothetical protein
VGGLARREVDGSDAMATTEAQEKTIALEALANL